MIDDFRFVLGYLNFLTLNTQMVSTFEDLGVLILSYHSILLFDSLNINCRLMSNLYIRYFDEPTHFLLIMFIGRPEFDIGRNTLNIVYSQTLIW